MDPNTQAYIIVGTMAAIFLLVLLVNIIRYSCTPAYKRFKISEVRTKSGSFIEYRIKKLNIYLCVICWNESYYMDKQGEIFYGKFGIIDNAKKRIKELIEQEEKKVQEEVHTDVLEPEETPFD